MERGSNPSPFHNLGFALDESFLSLGGCVTLSFHARIFRSITSGGGSGGENLHPPYHPPPGFARRSRPGSGHFHFGEGVIIIKYIHEIDQNPIRQAAVLLSVHRRSGGGPRRRSIEFHDLRLAHRPVDVAAALRRAHRPDQADSRPDRRGARVHRELSRLRARQAVGADGPPDRGP